MRHTVVELGDDSVATIVDYNAGMLNFAILERKMLTQHVDRFRVVSKIDKFTIDEFLKDVRFFISFKLGLS